MKSIRKGLLGLSLCMFLVASVGNASGVTATGNGWDETDSVDDTCWVPVPTGIGNGYWCFFPR